MSKPVPTDLIGSVRELRELRDRDRDTECERGVKVRPRGRTLRDWRGKGPMVKGGRGYCWEKESERDGVSERGGRESERQRKTK